MQLCALLHMMGYFSEYIVNLKKKSVMRYIIGCAITYLIYFFFNVYALLTTVGHSHSPHTQMTQEWLRATELLYVISNFTISVICVLSWHPHHPQAQAHLQDGVLQRSSPHFHPF